MRPQEEVPVSALRWDTAPFRWHPVAILRALFRIKPCSEVGGGHLGEPDSGSIFQDRAHDGLVRGREAPAQPNEGFHDVRALEARSTQ